MLPIIGDAVGGILIALAVPVVILACAPIALAARLVLSAVGLL